MVFYFSYPNKAILSEGATYILWGKAKFHNCKPPNWFLWHGDITVKIYITVIEFVFFFLFLASGLHSLTFIRWFYFISFHRCYLFNCYLYVFLPLLSLSPPSFPCYSQGLQKFHPDFPDETSPDIVPLQEFSQCFLKHAVLPVSLPHRPIRTEHFRS